MTSRTPLVTSAVLVLAGLAAGTIAYPLAPLEVAIHWSACGSPDATAPRELGLFVVPVLAGVTAVVIASAIRGDAAGRDAVAAQWNTAAFALAMLVLQVGVVAHALVAPVSVPHFALGSVAVVQVAFGLTARLLPQNSVVGIRTSRTLNDPAAWERVHRRVGVPLVVGAVVLVVCAARGEPFWLSLVLGTGVPATVSLLVASRA